MRFHLMCGDKKEMITYAGGPYNNVDEFAVFLANENLDKVDFDNNKLYFHIFDSNYEKGYLKEVTVSLNFEVKEMLK